MSICLFLSYNWNIVNPICDIISHSKSGLLHHYTDEVKYVESPFAASVIGLRLSKMESI